MPRHVLTAALRRDRELRQPRWGSERKHQGASLSSARCASLEVLPAKRPMPHKGCYRARHPKGGPVTKPARVEYTETVRRRYVAATRELKSQILDEYCRTLRCHRKAAIGPWGESRRRGNALGGACSPTGAWCPRSSTCGRSAIGSVASYWRPPCPR